MTWFAFHGYNSGKAIDIAGLQEKEAVGQGFHGYGSEKQAEAQPNSVNILQKAFVNAIIADYNAAVKQGSQPGGPNNILTPGGLGRAVVQGSPLGGLLSGIGEVGAVFKAFFSQVTKLTMWRSLGWCVLGVLLIVAGVAGWARSQVSGLFTNALKGSRDSGNTAFTVDSPMLSLILILTGAYLLWFGIAYWEDTSVTWPSDPIKSILTNKGLPNRAPDVPAATLLANAESQASQAQALQNAAGTGLSGGGGGGGGGGSAPPGNTGASSPSAAQNQSLAKMLAISMGHPDWTKGQQWADWVSLWNRESGWSTTAVNPSSGATGIPQLLPGAHAIPPNWSSARVQITWGITYILGRYGSPSAAWAHEESAGWY